MPVVQVGAKLPQCGVGNLLEHPRAGLLFIDFERGDLLVEVGDGADHAVAVGAQAFGERGRIDTFDRLVPPWLESGDEKQSVTVRDLPLREHIDMCADEDVRLIITIGDVLFATNQATLTPNGQATVRNGQMEKTIQLDGAFEQPSDYFHGIKDYELPLLFFGICYSISDKFNPIRGYRPRS